MVKKKREIRRRSHAKNIRGRSLWEGIRAECDRVSQVHPRLLCLILLRTGLANSHWAATRVAGSEMSK